MPSGTRFLGSVSVAANYLLGAIGWRSVARNACDYRERRAARAAMRADALRSRAFFSGFVSAEMEQEIERADWVARGN